jgi:gamma-glutamylaminecyclotransferase
MSAPAETFLLFVYGTLMRGGCRHPVLAGQRFLGPARTEARYVLHHLGEYPGLVHAQGEGHAVHGELYETERGLIPRLDEVEGSPSWFRLEEIALAEPAGVALAYFYQGDPAGRPLCPEGRWSNPRDEP